jgi:hypothetical protein
MNMNVKRLWPEINKLEITKKTRIFQECKRIYLNNKNDIEERDKLIKSIKGMSIKKMDNYMNGIKMDKDRIIQLSNNYIKRYKNGKIKETKYKGLSNGENEDEDKEIIIIVNEKLKLDQRIEILINKIEELGKDIRCKKIIVQSKRKVYESLENGIYHRMEKFFSKNNNNNDNNNFITDTTKCGNEEEIRELVNEICGKNWHDETLNMLDSEEIEKIVEGLERCLLGDGIVLDRLLSEKAIIGCIKCGKEELAIKIIKLIGISKKEGEQKQKEEITRNGNGNINININVNQYNCSPVHGCVIIEKISNLFIYNVAQLLYSRGAGSWALQVLKIGSA